jgi:hypothetical protein
MSTDAFEPRNVRTGLAETEAHTLAIGRYILEKLVVPPPLGEPITPERFAETRSTISELPLPVGQAWSEALIDAASLFHRKFLE